jgi:ABC-type multidrug transport system ATPase subunit
VGILLCIHLLDYVDRLCSLIGILHQGKLTELLATLQTGRRCRVRVLSPPDIISIHDGRRGTSPMISIAGKENGGLLKSGAMLAYGVAAWISLINVSLDHEQPLDFEDWIAHKAVTQTSLEPENQITVEWPMRLIRVGYL